MTATRTSRQITIDGEKFEVAPMDHGGWSVTYKDLVLAATDGAWISADTVDFNTDKGEDEIRWTSRKAAIARVRETCRMN